MNIEPISPKEQKVLRCLLEKEPFSSSDIYTWLAENGESTSLATVKRSLLHLSKIGAIRSEGMGRATTYHVLVPGRIFADIDAHAYCAIDPDRRFGNTQYLFGLFPSFPANIFSSAELAVLGSATVEYRERTREIPPDIEKKELERLIIELSWKSSRIEGNTYTILDTEKLLLENKEAPGHDPKEARMILNHKDAFAFVREQSKRFQTPTRADIEELHRILVKDLSVGFGLREKPVGITGSRYCPLDNVHQIREGLEALLSAITRATTPFDKALLAILGTSYLQPFEDGNKRTARLLGNAILLAFNCAPLSYRSVEESTYREATMVFYEINSVVSMKRIFINQYDFAARNYLVKRKEN